VIRLRALGRYVNEPRNLAWNKGEVFEADADLAAFLLADAPGTFERVAESKSKAITEPAMDKAIKSPDKAK
jgi:hypothetical protein